jgi:excisionase family DNA binding protein
MSGRYSMKQAAAQLGVHKLTLYRWERTGQIPAAKRFARKNERVYTDEDIQRIRDWKDQIVDPSEMTTA